MGPACDLTHIDSLSGGGLGALSPTLGATSAPFNSPTRTPVEDPTRRGPVGLDNYSQRPGWRATARGRRHGYRVRGIDGHREGGHEKWTTCDDGEDDEDVADDGDCSEEEGDDDKDCEHYGDGDDGDDDEYDNKHDDNDDGDDDVELVPKMMMAMAVAIARGMDLEIYLGAIVMVVIFMV